MSTYRILLTEDDPDIRELVEFDIQRILDSKCQIDLASNGQQAINFLKETQYDVVISDYHLPDISGEKVQNSVQSETPFIFMSGDIRVNNMCDGKRVFALEKPFRSEQMAALLQTALRGKQLLN
ncbi:response regulator [Bacteriovorax sp. DB6_IX]|uniref:response regulator n=1 Tax=Bacteriovorax sp. DB6_IX TaxID=1353530 RepID=UPI00038A0BEE|nr:response regulator [Bacteriovorax sp. DB6_IX]EQC49029.1 response regulator receiver domain protein [Bacteriovorax sp. DB6_IX]